MNTHLSLSPEFEQKLALSLTSLSPETEKHHGSSAPSKRRRRALACLMIVLIVAVGLTPAMLEDGLFQRLSTGPAPAAGNLPVSQTETDAGKPAQPIEVAIAREVTGSGLVVAPRMTAIFAKYEGRVIHIAVEVGEQVEKGAPLVTLQDTGAAFALETAVAAKRQADLMLEARDIDLAQARTVLARTESLVRRNAISRQELDEAQTAFEQAKNAWAQALRSLENAKLSVRIAEERLAELTVRAPFAGTITRLDAHVGDTILARADSTRDDQSLLTIADMTNLVIDADVAETIIASLEPGLKGQATLDGFPDQPFAIEVTRIAPIVSAEKGTVTLRLSLEHPPEGIRPNMAARVRIPLDHDGDKTP